MQFFLKQTGITVLQILIFYCVGCLQTAEEFFKRGKEYQSKLEDAMAADSFGAAIKIKPDDAEAYFERGRTNQLSVRKYFPNYISKICRI